MKWNAAINLLDECEQGLRKLVAETAGAGDYAGVHRIANLAKAVAALAAEGRDTPGRDAAPMTAAPATGSGRAGPAASIAAITAAAAGRKARVPAVAYPKFFRRGDDLVKVGWSKKDRKEYNHRAPRAAVDAVAAAVRQVGAKGKLFNGDALLPVKNPVDGSGIPDYQAYVALAWLKHLGLVEQHGIRGGYTLAVDKQLDTTTTAKWPELAEWRG